MNVALRIGLCLCAALCSLHAAALNSNQLENLLKNNPQTHKATQSIEELLPVLPREFRYNFTFVYDSRSPFKDSISKAYPRVILFSDDGKMILTFTGQPEKPGYNILESSSFDDETRSFEFRKYVLPQAIARDQDWRTNSQECAKCHGQDARPIFDSYPLWPGFYGSVRDTFPHGSRELTDYQTFLNSNAKFGVYARLDWPPETSTPPYLDPAKFDPKEISGSLDQMVYLPNTRLGMALTELNRKRIARLMQMSPRYRDLRKSILAKFLKCGAPVSADTKSLQAELQKENDDRLLRLGDGFVSKDAGRTDMMELDYADNLTLIDNVARDLGVDKKDWSMALEPYSHAYFDGILSSIYNNQNYYLLEDYIIEILDDLAKDELKFKPFDKTFEAYIEEPGYPFGRRLDWAQAKKACKFLN